MTIICILASIVLIIVILCAVIFSQHRQLSFLNVNMQRLAADMGSLQGALQGMFSQCCMPPPPGTSEMDFPFERQRGDDELPDSSSASFDESDRADEAGDEEQVKIEMEVIDKILREATPVVESPVGGESSVSGASNVPSVLVMEPVMTENAPVVNDVTIDDSAKEINTDSQSKGSKRPPPKNFDIGHEIVTEDGQKFRVKETKTGQKRWEKIDLVPTPASA